MNAAQISCPWYMYALLHIGVNNCRVTIPQANLPMDAVKDPSTYPPALKRAFMLMLELRSEETRWPAQTKEWYWEQLVQRSLRLCLRF